MNSLTVKGGTKIQRQAVEAAVGHAIQELMPRMKTLDIQLDIVDIKSAATGFCMMTDDNRTFEIEVDRKQGLLSLISTVLHEMVHVKQYARREIDGVRWQWRKTPVSEDTAYADLPWEVEAYELQDTLLQSMVDKDLF